MHCTLSSSLLPSEPYIFFLRNIINDIHFWGRIRQDQKKSKLSLSLAHEVREKRVINSKWHTVWLQENCPPALAFRFFSFLSLRVQTLAGPELKTKKTQRDFNCSRKGRGESIARSPTSVEPTAKTLQLIKSPDVEPITPSEIIPSSRSEKI